MCHQARFQWQCALHFESHVYDVFSIIKIRSFECYIRDERGQRRKLNIVIIIVKMCNVLYCNNHK